MKPSRLGWILAGLAALSLALPAAMRTVGAQQIQAMLPMAGTVAYPLPVGQPFTLEASVTKAATATGTTRLGLGPVNSLVVTLDITVAERDSSNETYDFYVTTGDGVASWDIIHFPQIATTGAKRYTATVIGGSTGIVPQTVTTAGPGVPVIVTGTMNTTASGAAEGTRTLAAGLVRHGVIGDRLGYDVVIAGTVATGITYSITATVH